mgnify:CR=1 FL=1
MKRVIAMLLVLTALFSTGIQLVYASELEMSEEEYLAVVTEIMKDYENNPEQVIQRLAEFDTTLI